MKTINPRFYIAAIIILLLTFTPGCGKDDDDKKIESVTDIEGNVYKTVTIGTQIWMAENLKTTTYNNGTGIPNVTDDGEWANLSTGAYAWYDNNYDVHGNSYGALYNWYALETGNLCPSGWHVPAETDWAKLVDYLINEYNLTNDPDDVNGVGNKLKSCRQENSPLEGECETSDHPRWDSQDTHYGTDEFGFSAVPGGRRNSTGQFTAIGGYGYWWSSTEHSTGFGWFRIMYHNFGSVGHDAVTYKDGFSVRCVRDVE